MEKFTDSSNDRIKLGDVVLFDEGRQIGIDGAVEAVFVYNLYYQAYGFSVDSGGFLPYKLIKQEGISFFKIGVTPQS
jgi:hypothetical protein